MSDRANFQASKKVSTARRVSVKGRQLSKDLPQQATTALLQTLVEHPAKLRPGDFLTLQRSVGNTIVRRLLAQGAAQRRSSDPPMSAQIQTKLTVGPANDIYEQEADRVAAQLMSIPDSKIKPAASTPLRRQRGSDAELQTLVEDDALMKPLAPDITPLVRRQFSEERETRIKTFTRLSRQAEGNLQTKTSGDGSFEVSSDLEHRINATRGGGSPLAQSTRDFMEPRFGVDLGAVRVHTNTEAAQMNRTLRAHAFTHGTDIYMGEGKYNPGSDAGKFILAHELTHVVQQTGRRPRPQSAGASSPAPVVSTATRLNRHTIQRFNPNTDNAHAPTTDLQHPALGNVVLANMDRYKFYPMQGIFKYQPPRLGNSVGQFLKDIVNDKNNAAQYATETMANAGAPVVWQHNQNPAINFPKVKQANPALRVAKATAVYNSVKGGGANQILGKVLDGLKSHNAGNTPRPFVSVVTEDGYGVAANAHTTTRHVIGGNEAPDAHAVALRAAFGLLGGVGGALGMYTSVATAFKTKGDANTDVANAVNTELTNNWKKHREKILVRGVIDIVAPRAGGQIVGYKSRTGAKWADAYKPEYLFQLGVTVKNKNPLFYPDNKWDTWAANNHYTARAKNRLSASPLTNDVSGQLPNVNVRIMASDNANHHGWFVHSAYPVY